MRIALRFVIMALAAMCAAVSADAQFRYGPVAGMNFSTLKFKQDIVTIESTPGFQAGLQAEMMFPGIGFGIDMGFIYNMSGAKVNLGECLMWSSQGYGNEALLLHQINLPFHLRFKYTNLNGLEEVFAPFVYGGPEFNILAAHSKCDAIQFAGGDLSLTAGMGFEINRHWQVSGSYTWGMTYCLKAKVLQDYSARGRQWTVRLAYLF